MGSNPIAHPKIPNLLQQFDWPRFAQSFHKSIAELEKHLILTALKEAAGNKTDAANRLQINRRLLYSKMTEHKIEEWPPREAPPSPPTCLD